MTRVGAEFREDLTYVESVPVRLSEGVGLIPDSVCQSHLVKRNRGFNQQISKLSTGESRIKPISAQHPRSQLSTVSKLEIEVPLVPHPHQLKLPQTYTFSLFFLSPINFVSLSTFFSV